MRFICDSMLGDIARWLRMLGYDTLYSRSYEDWEILRIARRDSRVILTKDVALYRRARKLGLKAVLIEEDSTESTLAKIALRTGIDLGFKENSTRCPYCNVLLVKLSKAEAISYVKHEVAAKYDKFWLCPRCGKVYWQGNHWETIREVLRRANKILLSRRVRRLKRYEGRKTRGASAGGGRVTS